jgi:RNA polymerase sigma-70 factor (ECF subfamily)
LATEISVKSLDPDFESIYFEHYGLVYRAAYSITGNVEDAEDVAQTLFLRLFERDFLAGVERNPKGFLYRSAVNAALDLARRRKPPGVLNVSLDENATTHAAGVSPGRESDDLREWLRHALTKLRPQEAEVFLLRHIEGYTNAEIARMLGKSKSAVAVTLFRVRLRLKKSIRFHLGRTS